jgi:signal transduction histidine kinase/ligand-binding sensor domain-containing protein
MHRGGLRPGLRPGLLLLLMAAGPAVAEQLPLRVYHTADGLVPGSVSFIHQDSKGYLWVGTGDGLSRFDGRRFVNYGLAEGLPHLGTTTIAEDRIGRLWVGTFGGGLARLDDEGAIPFRAFATEPPQVMAVGVAGDGTLYWVSSAGIHRGRQTSSGLRCELLQHAPLLRSERNKPLYCRMAAHDEQGRLWFGVRDHLARVEGASVVTEPPAPGQAGQPVLGIAPEPAGGMLVVYPAAVFRWRPAEATRAAQWTRLPAVTGVRLTGAWARRGGALLLGAEQGLVRYGGDGPRLLTRANGLSHPWIVALGMDREGGVWIGSARLGRLTREVDFNVTGADGVEGPWKLAACPDGRVYVSAKGGVFEVGGGAARVVPVAPAGTFDDARERLLCDRRGRLWIGTDGGLHVVDGLETTRPSRLRLGPAQGMLARGVSPYALYEDHQGHVWFGGSDGSVYRSETSVGVPALARLPPPPTPARARVRHIARDHAGGLWVVMGIGDDSRLFRFAGGRWTSLRPRPGLPTVNVRAMLVDRHGRLWLGLRFHGVSMTTDPAAHEPAFVNFTTRDGLPHDAVRAIAEDAPGRLYFGTGRGVGRLDPATGAWRLFGNRDGLVDEQVMDLHTDAAGALWALTANGVSRLDVRPGADRPGPPPVYIVGVRTPGTDVPVPPRGAVSLPPLTLPPSASLGVEFTAPLFATEGARFQYRLRGGDDDDAWSPPQTERAVNFARLPPGSFHFEVRALDADGRPSPRSAALAFRVRAPFWRHPSTLAAAALVLAAAAFGAHRWRLARALALERLRRQIATDLHDDVGSGLTEIALVSEVARRDGGSAPEKMEAVAGLARALRASMSDIVWAVDPRRDRLTDLVDRMRQAAFNMAEADAIRVDFDVPPPETLARIHLTPDRKRHLLLAFREAISNVARHSRAGHVAVGVEVGRRSLVLTVRDDGSGFDRRAATSGVGLGSLERRAAETGGSIEITSAPGLGTLLRLEVPLG